VKPALAARPARLAGLAWLAGLLVALGSALAAGGCATYSERTAFARDMAAVGSYQEAAEAFDKALGVDDQQELPRRFGADTALLLLERGMVSQAQGSYGDAASDLGAADEHLEYLDIAKDPIGTIGKYLYSDSSADYRASPVEKLALNSVNMLNYLARGDLPGARVEAKRYTVMREYFSDAGDGEVRGTVGAYLAGFVFEQLGDANAAMRYYDQALDDRDLATLAAPLASLARRTAYRGKNLDGYLTRNRAVTTPADPNGGEILTVVSLGRVPYKIPERMPIGAAIGIAGTYVTDDLDVLGYTALKVLVYPELQPASVTFTGANVTIDGRSTPLELTSDFAAEVTEEYEIAKPKIIGAALSRMLVRAGAAEGARKAGKQAGDAAAVVGWLAALATEATLVALDKPDTRSWTLLPGRVLVSRKQVAAGRHQVAVALQGYQSEVRTVDVDVPPGGFATVVVTPLR